MSGAIARELSQPRSTHPPRTPGRVLVVDDNDESRAFTQRTLERAGYGVDAVAGGDEAVAHATAIRPDLVIMDYMMPDEDGPQVVDRLRGVLGSLPPLIFLTASSLDEHVEEALSRGASDYVVRPVDGRVLVARVKVLLEAARHRAERELLRTSRPPARKSDLERDLERAARLTRARRDGPAELPGWRIECASQSVGVGGGDFVDIVRGPSGRFVVLFVDVSGHGSGAMVSAAVIRSELHGLVATRPLDEAIVELNEILVRADDELYACLVAVELGPDRLRVINAGMPEGLVVRADTRTTPVPATATAPGLLDHVVFRSRELRVSAGDRLVFASDGLSEDGLVSTAPRSMEDGTAEGAPTVDADRERALRATSFLCDVLPRIPAESPLPVELLERLATTASDDDRTVLVITRTE